MPASAIQQQLALAMQHIRANRLIEAQTVLNGALNDNPVNDQILAAMAQVAFLSGRVEEAVQLLRRASELKPLAVEYKANLGLVLSSLGRTDEAIEVLRSLLTVRPDLPEVWNNLGVALKSKGRLAEAEGAFRRALDGRPGYVDAMSNLGVVLEEQGRLDEARAQFEAVIRAGNHSVRSLNHLGNTLLKQECFVEAGQAYLSALEREPGNGESRLGFGAALHRQGKFAEAAEQYRLALSSRPAEAHYNLGRAAHDLGNIDQAIAAYRQAVAIKPDAIDAVMNGATLLLQEGRPAEAEAWLRTALPHAPNVAKMWNTLGGSLTEQDRYADAIEMFDKALAIDPTFDEAVWNRSVALLKLGRLPEAWEGYEARAKLAKVSQYEPFDAPRWRGEDLGGRTILLHAEQGFGDTIQFVRYVPMVRGRGGRVIVACPRVLHRLLAGRLGIEQVVSGSDPMAGFDVQCPLPSLPGIFGTTVETIPGREPYLAPDSADQEKWQRRVSDLPGKLRIGLVWAGNPEHSNDKFRSVPLSALAPLGDCADVTVVSLQKGPEAKQAQSPPAGMRLVDWSAELNDFAETAALLVNLDLVISVDTAVVHLAGAMGKAVWVMLPRKSDWRWLMLREDSPWYPSVRLFRQRVRGQWAEVIERIAGELGNYRKPARETNRGQAV